MNSDSMKKRVSKSVQIDSTEIKNVWGEVVKPNKNHLALLRKTLMTLPGSVIGDVWNDWYEMSPWGLWRKAHLMARPNLGGANLAGTIIPVGNFSNVKFMCANLSHSCFGNLHKSDLSECNLERADLIAALLDECSFYYANLKTADLSDSSASGADFTGANLQGAILCESEMFGACFIGADLRGAHLNGGEFDSSNFQDADFRKAETQYGSFQSCDFAGADLTETDFGECDLTGATFDGAIISQKTKVPKSGDLWCWR
jgi:uncharacterized protein YjbI with pentapeptide repeats